MDRLISILTIGIIRLISIYFVKFQIFTLISIYFINFQINTSILIHHSRKPKIVRMNVLWLFYPNYRIRNCHIRNYHIRKPLD